MSAPGSPRRWLDRASGAPSPLRALLRSAGDDDPTPAQLADLDLRLASVLGNGPTSPSGAPPAGSPAANVMPSSAPAAASALRMAIAGVCAVTAIGLSMYLSRGTSLVAMVVDRRVAPLVAELVGNVDIGDAPGEVPEPTPAASALLVVPSARAPVAAVRPAPTTTTEPAEVVDEVELLRRAHRETRSGQPAKALALVDRHAKEFPRSPLVQERSVVAIEALAAAGRLDEARARADAFRRAYPSSAYIRRIDAVLGTPAPALPPPSTAPP